MLILDFAQFLAWRIKCLTQNSKLIAHYLAQIVDKIANTIHSQEFLSAHRKKPTDFIRNRTLTFPRMMSFMLNAVNGSLQTELSRFFSLIDDGKSDPLRVSTAAFSKARKKLSYTAFTSLNDDLTDAFNQSSFVKRWNGFRLLSVDGSVTRLPMSEELLNHFGKARQKSTTPAVRISQLYDVKNKLTLDLQVDSHKVGEREQALKHLHKADKNDLILYDRGYPAVWFFKIHLLKGIDFCSRVTLDSSNVVKEFLRSGKYDDILEFPCIEKSLRRCRKESLPTDPIRIRLVRIDLPSGTPEILLTSLKDQTRYPYELFADLYHQRWDIEEDYKRLKSRLTIENFSGTTVDAILQDIHAKTLTKNIAALAIMEAELIRSQEHSDQDQKHLYKINWSHALGQIKYNIVKLTLGFSESRLSKQIILSISRVLSICRKGRSFERSRRKMNKLKYPMPYKMNC